MIEGFWKLEYYGSLNEFEYRGSEAFMATFGILSSSTIEWNSSTKLMSYSCTISMRFSWLLKISFSAAVPIVIGIRFSYLRFSVLIMLTLPVGRRML